MVITGVGIRDHKELVRGLQSLSVGRASQKVLHWLNKEPNSSSKDFSELS